MRISDWSSDVCSSDLATPLGQSGMTCALQADHGGVCAASPNGNWHEGWISEPPLPVAAFVDPLDNDQLATLLSTLDAKIKARSDDQPEPAWLLPRIIDIRRLRHETSKLSAKPTQPLADLETQHGNTTAERKSEPT